MNKGGRPKEYSADDVFDLLPGEGMTTTEWREGAESELGIKERRFYQIFKALKDDGRVLKSKVDHKWQPITQRS